MSEEKTISEEKTLEDEALDSVSGGISIVIPNAPAQDGRRRDSGSTDLKTPGLLSADDLKELLEGDKGDGQQTPKLGVL